MAQGIKQTEGIDLRFQIVVEHSLEGRHLRIHYHDVGCDASLAQCHTFIGNGNSKIVNTVVLQRLSYLNSTSTISVSLNHAHEFCFRFHVLTIPIEVCHYSREVDLKNGFMYFLHQLFCYGIEGEMTCTLDEYHLIVKSLEVAAFKERLGVVIETAIVYLDEVGILFECRTDADKAFHTTTDGEVRNLTVERAVSHATLLYVAENEGMLASLLVRTAMHEVECYVETGKVGVVGVVDESTTITPHLHFEAHSNRFEDCYAVSQFLRSESEVKGCYSTCDGIFYRSLANVVEFVRPLNILIGI